MPVVIHRLKKRCGAKTRSGGTCQRWAGQSGKCAIHGDKSLRDIAHPQYEHGRRIKKLPTRMIEDAQAAYRDPQLASLREDIVITDARIADLQNRVDSGESGRLWRDLKTAWDRYRMTEDEDEKIYWGRVVSNLMEDGVDDYNAWDEVVRMQQHKAKLVAQETKRLVQNGSMIPAENALAIFGRIRDEVRKNVTDRHALANISRVMSTLVSGPVIEVTGVPRDDDIVDADTSAVS